MTITAIAKGTLNWDVPLNQQLAQLDANITAVAGSVANTMDTTSNQTVTGTKTFATQTNFQGNSGAAINISSNTNGDTNARFALSANGTVNWGPGNATTDTNLYRASAGQLQTDNALAVLGTISSPKTGDVQAYTAVYSGANTTQAAYNYTGAGTTSRYADLKITGDSSSRLAVFADGTMSWGPGSASRDTNLYRSAVNTLKTDNSLVVGTNLSVIGIGAVASAYKTTDESRASNVSVAADGALNVTIPSAGTYIFQALIVYQTLQAAGFQASFSFTGTTSASVYTVNALSGGGTTDTGNARWAANAFGSSTNFTSGAGTGVSIAAFGEGSFVATSTGTLRFNWAQQTSNATSTVVKAGSYLTLTRIA